MAISPEASPFTHFVRDKSVLDFIKCLPTDPVDMDYIFKVDPDLGLQVLVVRLETESQIHQIMVDATRKVAALISGRG